MLCRRRLKKLGRLEEFTPPDCDFRSGARLASSGGAEVVLGRRREKCALRALTVYYGMHLPLDRSWASGFGSSPSRHWF